MFFSFTSLSAEHVSPYCAAVKYCDDQGELHLTESVCPRDFLGELQYWGLSALHLEPCCAYTLQRASWLLPIVDKGKDEEEEVVVSV